MVCDRRRRGAAALLVAALGLAACGGGGESTSVPGSSSTCALTVRAGLDGRVPVDTADRPAVAATDLTLVDRSRATPANGDAPPSVQRRLPTRLYVPVRRAGPLPLFVWNHGLGASGPSFDAFVCPIAGAGYAVAVPTFPLSNIATPGGPVFDAYRDQPADVSFLIDEVTARYGPMGHTRRGLVDPDRIAVGGHSLGAITTDGVVVNTCCADRRVRAAVEVAGSPRPYPGGRPTARGVPTLVIHGDRDAVFPLTDGRRLYDRARPPKAFLVLEGAGHAPFLDASERSTVEQATIAWLDAHLRGRPDGLDRLRTMGSRPGRTRLVADLD